MSIAALITTGIGPGSSILYVMTGGLDIGTAPPPPSMVYAGYPVRNEVLKSRGFLDFDLNSRNRQQWVLKGSPIKPRRLQS